MTRTPDSADRWPPPRDPGRQPERTRLAWRRTVLAATVVALLAVRLALGTPAVTMALTVAAAVTCWLAILAAAGHRITAMAAAEPSPVRRMVPLATVAVLGFAGIGAVLVFTG